MVVNERTRPRAFTLIELLVVVAIIALLISILMPSLTRAREQARAAKCGAHLRQAGTGLQTYFSEYNDWIPGPNTSGILPRVAKATNDANLLRKPYVPIQSFDWISPFMRYTTDMGANRAERLLTLLNEYSCPSVQGLHIDQLYPNGLNDSDDHPPDFDPERLTEWYAPLSYLMPAHFQWWGLSYANATVATAQSLAGRPIRIPARTTYDFFSTRNMNYQSRLNNVGSAARKIAAADGMRYLDAEGFIDIDVDPDPDFFGSFCSNGGWYSGAQAYGVRSGTANWDGRSVSTGSASDGQNLVWSYRHGGATEMADSVQSNGGEINALFFDGHVARLNDRASREIEYWYPSGTTVQTPGDGLTNVPQGYEVP